jgi:hypothetical protein
MQHLNIIHFGTQNTLIKMCSFGDVAANDTVGPLNVFIQQSSLIGSQAFTA